MGDDNKFMGVSRQGSDVRPTRGRQASDEGRAPVLALTAYRPYGKSCATPALPSPQGDEK